MEVFLALNKVQNVAIYTNESSYFEFLCIGHLLHLEKRLFMYYNIKFVKIIAYLHLFEPTQTQVLLNFVLPRALMVI